MAASKGAELPNKVYRVAEFPGNTLCEGTFDLPAGDYVAFSPSPEDLEADGAADRAPDVAVGVATELTITEPAPADTHGTTLESTAA